MDFLTEVEKKLDLPPGEKAQVIRELKSHYEEVKSELAESGTDGLSADEEAARRLGNPQDIASRLQEVHSRATWKSAFLTALPFLGALVFVEEAWLARVVGFIPARVLLDCFAAMIVIGTWRELVRDRRPIWLPTWLAAAILTVHFITNRIDILALKTSVDAAVLTGFVLLVWRQAPSRWLVLSVILFMLTVSALGGVFLPHNWTHVSTAVNVIRAFVVTITLLGLLFLWVAVVVKTFSWHRYGDIAQAGLFSFGLSVLLGIFGPSPDLGTDMLVALGGLVALVSTRMATWRAKLLVLGLGLLAESAIFAAYPFRGWNAGPVFYSVFWAFWVFGVPLLAKNMRYGGRLKYSG